MTGFALATLLALSAGAMAEPPSRVKYAADKGDVTFDHAAHLARRESCKTCHGDGTVTKIQLDKRSAHVLCVGCHAARRAGPKACTECHEDA